MQQGRRFARMSLLLIAVAPALAQTPLASRGELLYDTHCLACHSTQLHWRTNKAALDWASLRFEVRRWQGQSQLRWGDDDIDEVTRYLNDRIYHFEPPASQGRSVSWQPAAPRS
jgi:hypothetical protein